MSSAAKGNGRRGDVLGNATRLTNQTVQLLRLAAKWAEHKGSDGWIKSVSVYPPWATRNGMWMVVGHGFSGQQRLVAFHRATDILSALVGFFSRAEQGKLEWKVDKYAEKFFSTPESEAS